VTTLLTVGNDSGVVGRCDAKCYNAKHPHCNCVCGGVNHGVGLATAVRNVAVAGQKMIDRYIDQRPELEANTPQLPLFDIPGLRGRTTVVSPRKGPGHPSADTGQLPLFDQDFPLRSSPG
jgi:hypothetical protein